jgi:hypothetical protein
MLCEDQNIIHVKNLKWGLGMVIHTCNPSCSGHGKMVVEGWPGKGWRPYLKNTLKEKELGVWLKWYSACLANAGP